MGFHQVSNARVSWTAYNIELLMLYTKLLQTLTIPYNIKSQA